MQCTVILRMLIIPLFTSLAIKFSLPQGRRQLFGKWGCLASRIVLLHVTRAKFIYLDNSKLWFLYVLANTAYNLKAVFSSLVFL